MTLEQAIEELGDTNKRLSATQLAQLSHLERDDQRLLAELWPDLEVNRRYRILAELAELAEDNIDLNFDAVFKTGLEDEEPSVRAAALRGLTEYEGRDLIATLAELVRNDVERDVRREAAIALGRYAVAAELGYLRQSDVDAVTGALTDGAEDTDEDEEVRARAIEALGAVTSEETENLIESIYQEDSLGLKIGAVDAMGRSCNEAWLPLVLREMQNPAPEMRHAAAFAAGEIGNESAVQPLKRVAVEDPDAEVRLTAVQALGEIGGQLAKVALKSVLYEGDEDLHEAIGEAIEQIDLTESLFIP
jgi:HEAT repeat protein